MDHSAPFYRTPAAFINNQRFMANVPFSYQPNMPTSIATGRARNIVNYADPNNRQNMEITIKQMLDLQEQSYEFSILNPEDVYQVFRAIDHYLIGAVPSLQARSMPHIVFSKRLCEFRNENFVSFQLAVLSNDGIMNEVIDVYGNDDQFNSVFVGSVIDVIPKELPKSDKVRLILRKIRKPPIDEALLDITRFEDTQTSASVLEDLLPEDSVDVDETFISKLYGRREA